MSQVEHLLKDKDLNLLLSYDNTTNQFRVAVQEPNGDLVEVYYDDWIANAVNEAVAMYGDPVQDAVPDDAGVVSTAYWITPNQDVTINTANGKPYEVWLGHHRFVPLPEWDQVVE